MNTITATRTEATVRVDLSLYAWTSGDEYEITSLADAEYEIEHFPEIVVGWRLSAFDHEKGEWADVSTPVAERIAEAMHDANRGRDALCNAFIGENARYAVLNKIECACDDLDEDADNWKAHTRAFGVWGRQ